MKENTFVLENSYLDDLFENAQEAIVVADKYGLVLRINREFTTLFGFSESEVIGKCVDTLLAPQEFKDKASNITTMAVQGENVIMDTVRQTKDGTLLDVSVLASPIESNGDKAAAFAIYRDISERKTTERALEQKIRFNKIVSAVSARFVTFSDFDQAVEQSLAHIGDFTNATSAVLFQFRESEPLVDCTHEWHKKGANSTEKKGQTLPHNKVTWIKKRLLEQCVLHFEDIENLPLQAAEGKEMFKAFGVKSCIVLPLFIKGDLKGFVGLCNEEKNGIWTNGDFTLFNTLSMIIGDAFERKKSEDSLVESEGKYRSVVERASDGIAVLQDGKIIFANKRLAEMWGGDVEELVNRPMIDFLHPDETAKVVDRYKKRMAGEDVPPIYETIMKSKDGSDICIELNVGVIPYQGQQASLVFVRDVSERKQAQTWRNILEGSIQAIAMTLEMRDPYTAGHQQRVTRLACAIAEEMGLTETQIEGLHFAGLIHDIGKVTIPAEILAKPGRLTETEFSIIQNHPNVAYDILKKIDFPWPVARIVLQHHEYLDGSGYPQGLKGDQILIEAKILTVADVVEAMASHRPYRPALGIDSALEEIKFGRGKRFDPEVVDTCVRLFETEDFRLD
jgi:PAS domain S-box-containing protein/putative nucleotidyltransferase with HDIG domain